MKIYLILLMVFPFFFNAAAQTGLKTFKPIAETIVDLSSKAENEIDRQTELLSKENLTELEKKELDNLVHKYGEVIESVWDIIDGGCSWYCGGGNYKVEASSQLKSNNYYSYTALEANDLSYKTAWIEGKAGDGIGEYIEYYFENNSPRISSIIISNGYQKSEKAWKENNRVKLLKLYVNGSAFGLLSLSDTKTDQEFKIGTFGHNLNGSDLILRFELVEVYKGDKFEDTAITEIYFDGIDVH